MESKIIKNIGDYEENVFVGMTLRQAVLGIGGVIIIALCYFFTYQSMNSDIASYVAIIFGLPCMLFAFFKPQGYKLEKYIAIWFESNLLSNKKRMFICENKFYEVLWKKDVLEIKLEKKLNKKQRRHKNVNSKKMDTKNK